MKEELAWTKFLRNLLIMVVGSRNRPQLRRPTWIIVLISIVCVFLVAAYIYPPQTPKHSACYFFSSQGCGTTRVEVPKAVARELTDRELESRVVINEILNVDPAKTRIPKVAFLFLTPGSLPFEKLWHMFFKGHEGKFSVYLHASREKPVHVSPYFVGREIHSEPVGWGKFSMVEAERRLLANALLDPDNQHFVLLSDSCIPVRKFDFMYNYLLLTNVSFVDCYVDAGPHGNGRYIERMLPEVEMKDFRKGSQWFSMKRQHAIIVMADSLYFTKFKHHCRPNMEGGKNCYADEHYLPTFFSMRDPGGIANWSVTYVDWSERKWHPRSYKARDISHQLIRKIASIDQSPHYTSDIKRSVVITPCILNNLKRPCYLFARKFFPETRDKLIQIFSNSTLF
ncbi:glycosyltransferase BC10-like [Arachis stenosperma]|uniref:glycosyltransferase BC10-like n=1 Tax=Arachis stenosperma TaxID=217475 RepID=UPI0025ABB3AC|nr:glycosyltransferase BC10-like [Arachis stenosperma]XP_057720672.1 glycosyltransferase BC10-like [Arachis stenosperma]